MGAAKWEGKVEDIWLTTPFFPSSSSFAPYLPYRPTISPSRWSANERRD